MDSSLPVRSYACRTLHTRSLKRTQAVRPFFAAFVIPVSTARVCTQRYNEQPFSCPQRRHTHTRRNVSFTAFDVPEDAARSEATSEMPKPSPLSCLPLSTLIRSYVLTSVSSYPILLQPSLRILTAIARAKSPVFNPDSNPLLRYALKKTFYAQFCAGETPGEVQRSISELKRMGYAGVILAHAKEVVLESKDAEALDTVGDSEEQARCNATDVGDWEQATLDTVGLAKKGDFVALKFTGAGRQALQNLSKTVACAPALEAAVHKVCRISQERGVRLLFDAEQARLQEGIDNWTIHFMKRYNKGERALVYGTYQAYARKTPKVLARHLAEAESNGFILGVKLVRGAYMGSDPREGIWPTIEETHHCYNGIAKSLITRSYGDVLQPLEPGASRFPNVDFVLASHNAESVALARELRDQQAQKGKPRIEMSYGQLMGMADNVSCEIVQTAKERSQREMVEEVDIPKAYKYLVWGKLGTCLKYLLRRAHENKDALTRTVAAREALGAELIRRIGL